VIRLLLAGLAVVVSTAALIGQQGNPTGTRASYVQVLADDIETLQPSLQPAFGLGAAGSITQVPAEVISGLRSVKGEYTGAGSFTQYLATKPSVLSFIPGQLYRVTFEYRIVAAPSAGFECLFYSPTGADQGSFLPSLTLNGPAGSSGSATLTNVLGPYSDYRVLWNVVGTGAIVIDNIQIIDLGSGSTVATDDIELTMPGPSSGLMLDGSATVTTTAGQIVDGAASVLLPSGGRLETNPGTVPLAPNTAYIVEVQYKILNRGTADTILNVLLKPAGSYDPVLEVWSGALLKNDETSGEFSGGGITPDANGYVIQLFTIGSAAVVVDNIRVVRLDPEPIATQPVEWTALNTRPYPRLGNYQHQTPRELVERSPGEGVPYFYTTAQIERRLAFADVVVGVKLTSQSHALIRRLRKLNPGIVVLPYRISQEQGMYQAQQPPPNATVDWEWEFRAGLAPEWFVRKANGDLVIDSDPAYVEILKMNMSAFCPTIVGYTFNSYLVAWVLDRVFASGFWDGIFFDNLFAQINFHIPHYNDPAQLDYDLNRNSIRDETPAMASESTRAGAIQVLDSVRASAGDLTLIVGNTGPFPELSLAPFVNGYTFECVNKAWEASFLPSGFDEPQWRRIYEAYLSMQVRTRAPHLNILQGCGHHLGLSPTAQDVRSQRMVLATALLGDGYTEYDLNGAHSTPFWFDEHSVNPAGTATEDISYRGYLGQALGPAVELTGPGVVVWVENFESGSFPASLDSSDLSRTYIGTTPPEVLDGVGSLILSNPGQTPDTTTVRSKPTSVTLLTDRAYRIEFDWRIVDTLDDRVQVFVSNSAAGSYWLSGIVKGDAGHARFPLTIDAAGEHRVGFTLHGRGKVAIDNIRVTEGAAGPWRRDFERGIVLVNPINRPYTFAAAELVGAKRILGTQDPVTNNGQPITGPFTLPAGDAIVLLSTCGLSVTPTAIDHDFTAATGQVTITTPAGCAWNASASPGFLTITGDSSGVGNGNVNYSVSANPGAGARVGAVTIAGRTVTVTQSGNPTGDLLQNGSFAGGLSNWQRFATPDLSYIVTEVTGGVLQFYRVPPPPGTSNQAVVFQQTGLAVVQQGPLTAAFALGNSSSVRKRVTVLIHESDFTDLAVCTYWLPPNSPLRPYQMTTHTTKHWSNATISFYAATSGSDGGHYLLDDVSMHYAPAESDARTDCVDPEAPGPSGGPSGADLLSNGDFTTQALNPWITFGQIVHQIVGGVFEFIRPAGTPAGVVLQSTAAGLAADDILTATLQLGNSSSVRKRVTVLLHDANFSDLSACTFWLSPGQTLSPYAMRAYATKSWTNATLSVYGATVGLDSWMRLDDVTFRRTPAALIAGTTCIEPGDEAGVDLLGESGIERHRINPTAHAPITSAHAISTAGVVFDRSHLDPSIGLRGISRAFLSFESMLPTDRAYGEVQISEDGFSWQPIAMVPFSDEWILVDLDLGELGGTFSKLRFVVVPAASLSEPPPIWYVRTITIQRFRPH
jgi:hypothetical protein